MRPRDWFLVGAKMFGLWACYRGLYILTMALVNNFINYEHVEMTSSRTISEFLFAAFDLAVGFMLLFGTDHITRLAFGEPAPDRPSDEAEGDLE
jgi:hypothetical protein